MFAAVVLSVRDSPIKRKFAFSVSQSVKTNFRKVKTNRLCNRNMWQVFPANLHEQTWFPFYSKNKADARTLFRRIEQVRKCENLQFFAMHSTNLASNCEMTAGDRISEKVNLRLQSTPKFVASIESWVIKWIDTLKNEKINKIKRMKRLFVRTKLKMKTNRNWINFCRINTTDELIGYS